ncbi:MAG: two-component system, OmpR family, copper resistance phosphate regulon response regulator CusR [Actinomycetota bacterium]|nr:two-component system, OmpR family, copper resistance phosphate regulon response regulator CusR [Actinomycetota bacterium]
MTKILVIDDEPGVLRFIRRALEMEGHSVVTAADGAEGLRLAVDLQPSLVILDLMLPGVSGRAVLAALLADVRPTRVLALCGPDDVPVRIRALDAASVDFLPKPFSLNGLLAHVRIRLRQDRTEALRQEPACEQTVPEQELFCGTLRLDLNTRRLHAQNRSVELSQREFALMQHLMRRAGRVCSRAELLSEVWGYAFDPGSNVVDVTIARLRSKIKGLRIETVRKVGYALQPA